MTKKTLPDIISRCMTRNGSASVQRCWTPSRHRATSTLRCPLSPSLSVTLSSRPRRTTDRRRDKQVSQVSKLFNRGLISENERYSQTINIWQATTDKVSKALAANLPEDNEIFMMADSGARVL
mgnify:CR=1 FL=1